MANSEHENTDGTDESGNTEPEGLTTANGHSWAEVRDWGAAQAQEEAEIERWCAVMNPGTEAAAPDTEDVAEPAQTGGVIPTNGEPLIVGAQEPVVPTEEQKARMREKLDALNRRGVAGTAPDPENRPTGYEMQEAISTALAQIMSAGGYMLNKFVIVAETIEQDTGEREPWTFTAEGATPWDVLGLLEWAKGQDHAHTTAHEVLNLNSDDPPECMGD